MTNLESVLKSRGITLPTKVRIIKSVVFSVVILELDHEESQRIDAFEMVLEEILESPLDNKEIKPVNSKGNQS